MSDNKVYAPVKQFLIRDTEDVKAITMLYGLSKNVKKKLDNSQGTTKFFYFFDGDQIFPVLAKNKKNNTKYHKIIKFDPISKAQTEVPDDEARNKGLTALRGYRDTLKNDVFKELGFAQQIKFYEYANELDSKLKPSSERFYDTLIGRLLENYIYLSDVVADFTLSMCHHLYYKRDGRDFEDRETSNLEKCYQKSLSIAKLIKSELEKILEEEYSIGPILDKLK